MGHPAHRKRAASWAPLAEAIQPYSSNDYALLFKDAAVPGLDPAWAKAAGWRSAAEVGSEGRRGRG
jgi:hypothetical protein